MNTRNQQIDGLRGIAILLVILFHFFERYFQLFLPTQTLDVLFISNWGNLGVCVFLVMAGLFLVDTKDQREFMKPLIKRICRLWPTYFFCITVTFVILLIWPLPGRTHSILTYLLNVTMLNGFVGVPYVDAAHWYLTTLLALSFMAALIKKLGFANKVWAYYVWMAIVYVLSWIKVEVVDFPMLTKLVSGVFALTGGSWIGFAISGIILSRIKNSIGQRNIWADVLLLLTACAFTYVMSGIILLINLVIAILIVWLALNEKVVIFKFKPLVYLGTISYSVYLIHQNIGYTIMYHLINQFEVNQSIAGFIAVCIAVLLGIGVHYLVEKPSASLVKKVVG